MNAQQVFDQKLADMVLFRRRASRPLSDADQVRVAASVGQDRAGGEIVEKDRVRLFQPLDRPDGQQVRIARP